MGLKNRAAAAIHFLIASWIGLVVAFVLAGTALAIMPLAAGQAIYRDYVPLGLYFEQLAGIAYLLIVISGGSLVASLIYMVAAAIVSLKAPEHSANEKGSASLS